MSVISLHDLDGQRGVSTVRFVWTPQLVDLVRQLPASVRWLDADRTRWIVRRPWDDLLAVEARAAGVRVLDHRAPACAGRCTWADRLLDTVGPELADVVDEALAAALVGHAGGRAMLDALDAARERRCAR